MNPYLLLSALRARSRVLLLILGMTVLVAAGVSIVMPKTYIATVAMMVDSKDDQSINSPRTMSPREGTGFMQTQTDLISSQKSARKVIRDLGLSQRAELQKAFQKDTGGEGTIENWLADILLKQIKVDTSQSSVIHIAYPSDNPQFSALVANAFAKAYMETALELRVEPSRQTAAWFDDQIKSLRDNVDKAQARLTEYQKEKGVVGIDERYDGESIALSTMATQFARSQTLRVSASGDERRFGASTNPLAQTLRTELLRSESRLAEMGSRLGSDHPQYQRQLAETGNLRNQLNREIKTVIGVSSSGSGVRRTAEMRSAMATLQARVIDLKHYRSQVGVLMREAEIAEKAYETAMQRAVSARVDSRANLTNISVLNPAVAPIKPIRPRLAMNLALALVVGTLLGLTTIYLMELFDRRVRSTNDLENALNIPYLGEFNAWQPQAGRLLGPPHLMQTLPGPG